MSRAQNLDIINMALARIGAEPIAAFPDTSTKNGKIATGVVYPQTVKEVLRMNSWACAVARGSFASAARSTPPAGDFTQAATIPSDCIRVIDIGGDKNIPFRIEGSTILHNIAAVNSAIVVRYVKYHTAPAAKWAASTAYAVGDYCTQLAASTGSLFICTVAGTSHSAEPSWSLTTAGVTTTTETGGVVWTYLGALPTALTYQAPDPATWDAILTEAIVARLASKIVHAISGKPELVQLFAQDYMVALASAKAVAVVESKEDVADILGFWTDIKYVMAKPRNEVSE